MKSSQPTLSKKEVFVNGISAIYPADHSKIVDSLGYPRKQTFRVNTHRISVQKVCDELSSLGFKVSAGPFQNSLYITEPGSVRLSDTDLFNNGKIYIQGFSSMLDVILLDPVKGDKVIDMCAAPGSKTSYISGVSGDIQVTALDNNINRFHQLRKNIETQGFRNVTFMLENASTLPYKHPDLLESFDKVLADVPCSNEGVIRLDGSFDFKTWNSRSYKHLPTLQKKILFSAYKMLKPGGTLIYSTCTYHPEENEEVVDWLLKKTTDMSIAEVQLPAEIGYLEGFTKWGKSEFNASLARTVRILPGELFDGFYIAKLIKKV